MVVSVEKAKELLAKQIELARPLQRVERKAPEFKKWHRDTSVVIERIFGADSRHVKDFAGIRYHLTAFSSGTPEHKFQAAYSAGIENACAILSSMAEELDQFGIEGD